MTYMPVRPKLFPTGPVQGEEGEMKDSLEVDEIDDEVVVQAMESDKEEEKADDDKEVESLTPRYMRDPGQPTQAEIDEHDILHLQYRSWCRWCVMGKGQSDHHTSSPKETEEITVPTISIDDFYLGTILAKAKARTVLGIYDNRTESLHAFMVHRKGPDEWVVTAAVKAIRDMGYDKVPISVKCDSEPSIKGSARGDHPGEDRPDNTIGHFNRKGAVQRCDGEGNQDTSRAVPNNATTVGGSPW